MFKSVDTKTTQTKKLKSLNISNEDWVKPLSDLDKDVVYLVGGFNNDNIITMIYFKEGSFYLSNKVGVQKLLKNNFKNLSRSYEYFEELFYKDCL